MLDDWFSVGIILHSSVVMFVCRCAFVRSSLFRLYYAHVSTINRTSYYQTIFGAHKWCGIFLQIQKHNRLALLSILWPSSQNAECTTDIDREFRIFVRVIRNGAIPMIHTRLQKKTPRPIPAWQYKANIESANNNWWSIQLSGNHERIVQVVHCTHTADCEALALDYFFFLLFSLKCRCKCSCRCIFYGIDFHLLLSSYCYCVVLLFFWPNMIVMIWHYLILDTFYDA